MKTNLLSFFLAFVAMVWSFNSQAQDYLNDFNEAYSGGFNSVDDDADPDEFQFSTADGNLVINCGSTSITHFIQHWRSAFDLEAYPYFKMKVKADDNVDLGVRFTDQDGHQISKEIKITTGLWSIVDWNLTSQMGTFSSLMQQIQFDPGQGDFTLYIDYLAYGKPATDFNYPPTVDAPGRETVDIQDGEQTLDISGIGDGNLFLEQNISLTAVSNDESIVNNVSVDYTYPDETATVSYTPVGPGRTTITVTVKDDGGTDDGAIDEKSDNVMITVEGSASIDEEQVQLFNLFPNPVKDMLQVNLPAGNYSHIEITDLSGKRLIHKSVSPGQRKMMINVEQLPPSQYIFMLMKENGQEKQTKLFVIE